jgi:hypothetical protein
MKEMNCENGYRSFFILALLKGRRDSVSVAASVGKKSISNFN